MRKKITKFFLIMAMIVTLFPSVPIFAEESLTSLTIKVGAEEDYTSLHDVFDNFSSNEDVALTIELTSNIKVIGNLEVPLNKGIRELYLVGKGEDITIDSDGSSAFFANGVTTEINNLKFGANVSIYGGSNEVELNGNTDITIYESTVWGPVYAGSLNGVVSGTTKLSVVYSEANCVVFGSNGMNNTLSRSNIDFSTVEDVYLGNINANTTNMPEHYFSGSTIQQLYVSKNGTVAGDVKVMVSPVPTTIYSFQNGDDVTLVGDVTLSAGFGDEQGDLKLTVGNLMVGSQTSNVNLYVAEKNTMKVSGGKINYLNSIELAHKAQLYLNDSYTISSLIMDNSTIYLPDSSTLFVTDTMDGTLNLDVTRTYIDEDVVVGAPLDTTGEISSVGVGVTLVKDKTDTNTVWKYSEDFVITVNVGFGGTVEKDLVYVTKGGNGEIVFKPNKGYVLHSVLVDGVDVTNSVSGHTLKLTNVQKDIVVDIVFRSTEVDEIKAKIDELPTSYSGIEDRDLILNTKISYEDFGGDAIFGAEYAQKMNEALMLLPQIEISSKTENASITNPEVVLSSLNKDDAQKILDGTYRKIVLGLHEVSLSYETAICSYSGMIYGEFSRGFHFRFGKRYIYTNSKKKDVYEDVDLTEDNDISIAFKLTNNECIAAPGYKDRRVLVFYIEGVYSLQNQESYSPQCLVNESMNPSMYAVNSNKLGGYLLFTYDVNSPSKDHIMVVFTRGGCDYFKGLNSLAIIKFLPKDENGYATLTEDLIPNKELVNIDPTKYTDGYWTPSIDTSVGGIKGDIEFVHSRNCVLADYSAVHEAIEKASVYTYENCYYYTNLKQVIDSIDWNLSIFKQKEVDAIAKKINDVLKYVRFKEADYNDVDRAIYEGETLILSNWVIDTEEFYSFVNTIDRSKNITQQDEVDQIAQTIRDIIARFELKPADYTFVYEMIDYANSFDKNLYENWSIVQDVINSIVYGLTIDKQNEINELGMAIDRALYKLIYKKADYSILKEIINNLPDLSLYENGYVISSIINDINWSYSIIHQDSVDEYVTKLLNAKNELVFMKADYQEINRIIDDFNMYHSNMNYYTVSSYQVVQDAIHSVDWNKTILEQDEVDGMALNIRKAIENIEYRLADYSEVYRLIENANMLNRNLYLNFDSLESEILSVKWGLYSYDQSYVDTIAQNLLNIINNLEYKPADYSELYNVLQIAENLNRSDYSNYYVVENYINNINWNYKIIDQTEVDNMVFELNTLINELSPVYADYTEVNLAIDRAYSALSSIHIESNTMLDNALNSVVRDLSYSQQAEVDSMAQSIYDAINSLVYTGNNYTVDVFDPSCTMFGFTLYRCECGDTFRCNYVDELGHNMSEYVVTKESTCTEIGIKMSTCTNCNHYDKQEISKTEHSFTRTLSSPTCTEPGYVIYTCDCNYSYQVASIEAYGHDMSWYLKVKLPSCTEDGLERSSCIRCEYSVEESINKLGHNYYSYTIHPTCTKQGYTEYNCNNCSDSYVDNYVDALEHDYGDYIMSLRPTCIEKGSEYHRCSRCYDVQYRDVPTVEHNYYIKQVVSPTCNDKGYSIYTCNMCEDKYIDNYVDELGHSFGNYYTISTALCDRVGYESASCIRCSEMVTREIPAKGHSLSKNVKEPTCMDYGYTTYRCNNCSYSYVDDYVYALGHDFVEFNVIKKPTIVDYGKESSYCQRCDYTEIDDIEMLLPVAKVSRVSDTSLKISWAKEKTVTGYEVYRSTSLHGKYTKVATIKSASTTSWTDTKRTNGTTYYYRIRGYKRQKVNGGIYENQYGPFSEVVAYSPLKTPTLTVTRNSYDSMQLSWKEISGADSYEIYRSLDNKNFELSNTVSNTNYLDSNLLTGKTYYYKVRVVKDCTLNLAYSSYSTVKSAKTTLTTPKVSITNPAYDRNELSWMAIDGADGYEVFRTNKKDGKYTVVADISDLHFVDRNVTIGTTYYYKVRGYHLNYDDTKGYSSYSNVVNKKVSIEIPKVSITKSNYLMNVLDWQDVELAKEYEVSRATSKTGKYVVIASTTDSNFEDTNIDINMTYYYKVRTVVDFNNTNKYSSYSAIVSKKVTIGTPKVTITNPTYEKNVLDWQDVELAKEYQVYRATSKTGKYTKVATVNNSYYEDTNVVLGKAYYYKVRTVVDVNGTDKYSSYSAIVSKKVALPKPTITVTRLDSKTADITIDSVYGAEGYEIYRSTSKTGTYSKVATVTETNYTNTKLANKTYYYKVRAYRLVSGKKVYSSYSNPEKCGK